MSQYPALPPEHHDGSLPALPALPGATSDFGSPQQQPNLFKMIHTLFRGRYLLTGALSLAMFVLAAAVAWFINKPVFESNGMIRVIPIQVDPLTNRTEVIPMVESYVRTQASLLQQPRVIAQAMSSKEWRDLGIPLTPQSERDFRNAISVRTSRDSLELINVRFSHPEAKVAYTGLMQVCQAYYQIYSEGIDRQRQETRTKILVDERRMLEQRIKETLDQIGSLAEELGTDEPAVLMEYQNRKVIDIDAQIYELKTRLIAAGGTVTASTATAAQPADPARTGAGSTAEQRAAMTMEEIASMDPTMNLYLSQWEELTSQRAQLQAQGALGPNHPSVKRYSREIDRLVGLMEERRQIWIETGAVLPPPKADPARASLPTPVDTVDSITRKLSELERTKAFILEESRQLARRKQDMEAKKQQVETDRAALADVVKAIDSQRREREMTRTIDRVEMILPERPEAFPSTDKRLRNGVIFGVLGAMLPVTVIGLYGLIDRRYRYSDEAIEEGPQNTPLLGILPRLPADLHDAEQAMAAAHCVHQIRTLVQISSGGRAKIYAVTSSNPGDGKTSMALALGYSYAGAGSRTLLVDLDLIGQGLSRGLKMREQQSLFQAIHDGTVRERVRETHMKNLFLLPTGLEDDHRSANRLSETQISRLMESVRDGFDVVLIDTGPVLGSIEAHLVCAQADAVILVVGAGRARGQVKAAVEQLGRVGARLLGLVFNLAQSRDFRTSAASQSFRSVRPDGAPPQRPSPTEFPDLEPLPRVVAIDTRR